MNTLDLALLRDQVSVLSQTATSLEEQLATANQEAHSKKVALQKELRAQLSSGDYSTGDLLRDQLLLVLDFTDEEGLAKALAFNRELELNKGRLLLMTHSWQVHFGMRRMFPGPDEMDQTMTEERLVVGRLSGSSLEIRKVVEERPEQEEEFVLIFPFERFIYEKIIGEEKMERKAEDGRLTLPWTAYQHTPSTISVLNALSGQQVFSPMAMVLGDEKTELRIGDPTDFIMPRQQALIKRLDYVEPAEDQSGGA